MARKPRVRASSGIYRVVLRGDMIFHSDGDAGEFLAILKDEIENDFAEVYAYCLLNKSIMLVIKEGLSGISAFMMRLCSKYSLRLKARYGKDFPKIFNGRFLSYPLEDDAEVLEGVRTTHQLPLKIGLKLNYEWSSYANYFKSSIVTSEPLLLIAGSIIDFQIYNERDDETEKKESVKFVLSDAELRRQITKIVKEYPPDTLNDEPVQEEILRRLRQIEGAEEDAIVRILKI